MADPVGDGFAGHDKFGSFTMTQNYCGVCAKPGIVVRYQGIELPTYTGTDGSSGPLKADRLVIGSERAYIGVSCGCYGRFHRQVATIMANNRKAR